MEKQFFNIRNNFKMQKIINNLENGKEEKDTLKLWEINFKMIQIYFFAHEQNKGCINQYVMYLYSKASCGKI